MRTGRYEVWESCGGTFNDIVTLAVRPDGADESVLLLVQVVDAADLVALDAAPLRCRCAWTTTRRSRGGRRVRAVPTPT